jgi:hypothetical protein
MITGAGTPLADILSNAQAVLTDARSSILGAVAKSTQKSEKETSKAPDQVLSDLVDLSDEVQDRLSSEQEALSSLQQSLAEGDKEPATEILGQQIAEINKQISILRSFVQGASEQQLGPVLRGLEQTAGQLKYVARQLGLGNTTPAENLQGTQINIEAVSLSLSFNQVASITDEQGNQQSYAQSLDIELSFINIEISSGEPEESELTGPANVDAFLFQQSGQSYSESVARNNISERSALPDGNSELIQEFNKALQSFTQLIEEFTEKISDEDRIPPSIINLIKDLVSVGEPESSEQSFDTIV